LRKVKTAAACFPPFSSWPFERQCCRVATHPAEARPDTATPIKVTPLLIGVVCT